MRCSEKSAVAEFGYLEILGGGENQIVISGSGLPKVTRFLASAGKPTQCHLDAVDYESTE